MVRTRRGGGVLLAILGGVVPPGSSNHDPISGQNKSFPIPLLRTRPLKSNTRFQTKPLGRNYVFITKIRAQTILLSFAIVGTIH